MSARIHFLPGCHGYVCVCGFRLGLAPDKWSEKIDDVTCPECRNKHAGITAGAKIASIRQWMKGRVSVHGESEDARSLGFMDALSELEELL